jgi:hypothetical protein
MKRVVIVFIFAFMGIATAVLAYWNLADWYIISQTENKTDFWTADNNPQLCDYDMNENDECQVFWFINSSKVHGKYNISVLFNSTIESVVVNRTENITVTIYEKGDNGMISNDTSCDSCSFVVNGSNPYGHGNMSENDNFVIVWNVTAQNPVNTTWDMFVNFTSGYKSVIPNATEIIKARIVNYEWRDTTGYINESWNCRKMVNITNGTGGTGIIEIKSFDVWDSSCLIMNCSKEIRVSEIFNNGSNQHVQFLNVSNEEVETSGNFVHCRLADIQFNATLTAGQTKSFFVYYSNPLIEIDYINPTGPTVFSEYFYNLNSTGVESVWLDFFDSNINFWIANASDDLLDGNTSFRREGNMSFNSLKYGYNPRVQVNELYDIFINSIPTIDIYFYSGHGVIINESYGYKNQTLFYINTHESGPFNIVTSDNITAINQPLKAKFVYIDACNSGDDDTTKICLDNWLSKAFTERGVKCYLGFQGTHTTENINDCGGKGSDTYVNYTEQFNRCFWGNITEGYTIRGSVYNATKCVRDYYSKNCEDQDCVHATLVNSTIGGCDIILIGGG